MKTYKSVLFIFSIILVLTIISFFFPNEGVKISDYFTLRFPDLENFITKDTISKKDMSQILSSMKENQVKNDSIQKEILVKDSILSNIIDSILLYQSKILNSPTKLYLPGDNIFFFNDIFNEMSNAKKDERIIRVLHYGDSQIEMDRITSNIRSFFQSKFGGGGPGMIPLVQTISTSSVSQRATGDIIADYSVYGKNERLSNGKYGIMGRCYRIEGKVELSLFPTAYKKNDVRLQMFPDVSVIYYNNGNELNLTLIDKRTNYKSTQTSFENGINKTLWHIDNTSSYLTLEIIGDADIFGVTLDNGYGVNVDNIPMRGSSGTIFTQLNKSSIKKMYELSDVGIVILQFGGNFVPMLKNKADVIYYANLISKQINYFKGINPNIKIIFIGPADMNKRIAGKMATYPLLPDLVDALKATVTANGGAFWDIFEVMGGENSMSIWLKNGYAVNDYIHFTTKGADIIGNTFTNTLEVFYDFHKYTNSVPNDLLREALEIISAADNPENSVIFSIQCP